MHAQSHRSDPRILGRRTLQHDHRALAERLRPGLSVLDVGCGTGAITSGIANAVGPEGYVLGMDRDASLLELARQQHAAIPNLRFEQIDATTLSFHARFDIVTAARTLQWISDPAAAVAKMKQAAKPSGLLVVLDYNHAKNEWRPDPPAEFRKFYEAFLEWREANHWDNQIADHLPELFQSAGLHNIESHIQDEIAERGDERTSLWSEVIDNVGAQITNAGLLTKSQLDAAGQSYQSWVRTHLITQTLTMRAVVGQASARL
jgi:ubiquinone/menaquinone biosynthesis C-methylase UbiE